MDGRAGIRGKLSRLAVGMKKKLSAIQNLRDG